MARVFVSHAGEDSRTAEDVRTWLLADRHEVFLDRDLRDGITVGEAWEQRLHERLRWADAVVCVVTSAYLRSPWCSAEVGIARSRGARQLPLRAEPGVVHPLLGSLHYADLTVDRGSARSALAETLRRVDAAGGPGWPDDLSPFPGLLPFELDQRPAYFGRSGEVEELAALLRSPAARADGAAVVVVGPSGCGKSSLVRAGLVPTMAEEPGWWTLSPITPGANPVGALTRELASAARTVGVQWTIEQVDHRLRDRGLADVVDEVLLAVPGTRVNRLLVVVDQLEEILTQTAATQRARFASLLQPAMLGPVQLVATLRPEFLDPLLVDPQLAELPSRTYPLRPLRRETLREVIEGPARLAGLSIDDSLVGRLVTDTDSGEALPLLAFTLAQLAHRLGRGGELSELRYEQIGGVSGAIARQADAALVDAVRAGGRTEPEVIAGLLRLVTVDERGSPTRWRVPLDDLPGTTVTELQAFVARRLLTTDTEQGRRVVGVAHEAFLSAWKPLARAITAASAGLRARRAVELAAGEWSNAGKPAHQLWERNQLAAAVADIGARRQRTAGTAGGRTRWPRLPRRELITDIELSQNGRAFLDTSMRRDLLRRARGSTILAVLLAVAVVAAGFGWVGRQTAEEQRRVAQEQQRLAVAHQLVAQADTMRTADSRTALLLGIAAERLHPDADTASSLVQTLSTTHYDRTLAGHTQALNSAAYTPDGRTIATGSDDDTVLLWDVTDPAQPRRLGTPLTPESGNILELAFAPPTGRYLAAATSGGSVLLWDLTDLTRPIPLPPLTGHEGSVRSIAFAADGRLLVSGGVDGRLIAWDLTDMSRPHPAVSWRGNEQEVSTVAFAGQSRLLAVGGDDHAVRMWDLTVPAEPRPVGSPLTRNTNSVKSVAFSTDGHLLATSDVSGNVYLWDTTDPARPAPQGGPLQHRTAVWSVAFTPDTRTLATGGVDGKITLWDVGKPAEAERTTELAGHSTAVRSVAVSPNGQRLITTSADRTAIIWDLVPPAQPRLREQPLADHRDRVEGVVVSATRPLLASRGEDNTVRLWDITEPDRATAIGRPLVGSGGTVTALDLAPGRPFLAVGNGNGTVDLWDLADPARPRPLPAVVTGPDQPVRTLRFSPDDRILVAGFEDGTVAGWAVDDPARIRPVGQPVAAHGAAILDIAFAPGRPVMATSSVDGTAVLWDLRNPDHRAPFEAPITNHTNAVTAVAFSPDGQLLATAGLDTTILLWDTADPAHPRRIGPAINAPSPVWGLRFAPRGGPFLAATTNFRVAIWALDNPTQPRQLGEPFGVGTAAAGPVVYTPDARTVAAGTGSGVALWNVEDLAALRVDPAGRACSMTGRGLDPDEWARFVASLPYEDTCSS